MSKDGPTVAKSYLHTSASIDACTTPAWEYMLEPCKSLVESSVVVKVVGKGWKV